MPPSPQGPLSSAAIRLLDSSPEEAFDRYTRLATQVLRVPVSLVSILDVDRQFFKSAVGLPSPYDDTRETPLSHSFCQHVVNSAAPLIITDAREDDRVRQNGAVADLGVIAYAGVPIFDQHRRAIGALCAIAPSAREWTPAEVATLGAFAEQVSNEIAMRETLVQMGVDLAALRAAEQTRHLLSRADRHDLRAPLNALALSLQAVQEFGPLNPDQKEFLSTAAGNLRTVLEMVDQLIDIGNVDNRGQEALQIGAIDARALIELALDQVRPQAREKGVRLLAAESASEWVLADVDKIVRVLVNLLTNGVKFTAGGGTVTVSFTSQQAAGAPMVRFSVADTGIGVARENFEKLFEEGFRVDANAPTRRSTGLGLTFCKRIVAAHSGEIWVESVLDQGTTFHFTLAGQPTPAV